MANPVCEIRNLSKSFGAVHANQDISFAIMPGTIHALVGENGAGKSTAMKMLFGEVIPDSGEIKVQGKTVFPARETWNPRIAISLGIAMVHQHFLLASTETALDNIVLGSESLNFGFWRDRTADRTHVQNLMIELGVEVPLDARVENLSVGQQALCEILKALYTKPKLLILDEPTAVMTPQEVTLFLNTLKRLRDQGTAILIVTHKLKEVLSIAETITVLRAGKWISSAPATLESIEGLSEKMIGRRVVMPKTPPLCLDREKVTAKLELNELKAWPGEIVGIAGVEGNGQEALVDTLFARSHAFIPADRHREGLVLDFNLRDNLRLTRRTQYNTRPWSWIPRLSSSEKTLLTNFDIRPNLPELPARALSGGNQQKLIIAREVGGLDTASLPNSVIVVVNPTRGVDVGAIEGIHRKLIEAAQYGATIILISSELDEIMSLSHRVGVLYRGQITQWFDGPHFDEMKIGQAMLGSTSPTEVSC